MAAAAKKLDVFSTTSDYSKTYVFHDEDHTLGNALRYVLMRNPDVDFCGYTIPHPSEPKMHIRLQTRQGERQTAELELWSYNGHLRCLLLLLLLCAAGAPSDEALRSGLTDLRKLSTQIGDAYRKELKAFKRKNRKN
ncbi:unnamed protein product [Phytophthora lilii]|uniref:Unnamed protein product n=1 Tax=Phytophthora lilii TaxID=2077276 RepID=A0A9W6WR70_9STRA|nr:unnamed protein product [Phytophthora lilii]